MGGELITEALGLARHPFGHAVDVAAGNGVGSVQVPRLRQVIRVGRPGRRRILQIPVGLVRRPEAEQPIRVC